MMGQIRQRSLGHRRMRIRILLVACVWLARCHPLGGVHGWRPRLLFRRGRGTVDDSCRADPFADFQDVSTFQRNENQEQVPPRPLFQLLLQIKHILMYEPPVGIVALYVTFRLFWTGRIFRIYSKPEAATAEGMLQAAEGKRNRRKVRAGRSLQLDTADQSYDLHGGVESVRRKLCWAALQDENTMSCVDSNVTMCAIQAMRVTPIPGAPREIFVEEQAKHLSQLQEHLIVADTLSDKRGDSPSIILQLSAQVAEIRGMDALLRLTRDRLLVTCSRLKRTVRHWRRRVRLQARVGPRVRRLIRSKNVEGHQLRLALAEAAYETEVARLGLVQRTLIERPGELGDKDLLKAFSPENEQNKNGPHKGPTESQNEKHRKKWPGFSLPSLSKYSLRWNADGRGRLTIRVYDGHTGLQREKAKTVLLENDPRQWIQEARKWTNQARRNLYNIIKESNDNSLSDQQESTQDLEQLQEWHLGKDSTPHDEQTHWLTVLSLVDKLEEHRRVGEGRTLSLSDGIYTWSEQLDVFGVPSALAAIAGAKMVHNYLVPYWPKFSEASMKFLDIAWTIIQKRFWKPFYGIVRSLISKKSSTFMDAFDVNNEEESLDNMLRDLGMGDGTAESRREALQSAARAYEKGLKKGALRSAVRGSLVRLLLVQVQQLKAGLLHALQSIDVLVSANKLNLQILTAIPSVLIVFLGTRFFLATLFTIRSRDIRPLDDVHAEMAQFLDEMEKTLLLACPSTGTDKGQQSKHVVTLPPNELGDFVLFIHSYLVLLDYCSPPFPSRSCESIHISMQELLALQGSVHGLEPSQQIALLRLLKQKHMDLLKYI